MIISMKRTLVLAFLLLTAILAKAQKPGIVVVPLHDNEAQREQYLKLQQMKPMSKAPLDTMQLPFFDDFSYADKLFIDSSFHGINPYDTLWLDHKVFVNCTMTDSAPSIGVATFDGLNEEGKPYDPFSIRHTSEPCDTLTSRPIDLGTISKTDTSVYFSFYYQPWGLGVAPKEEDTLVLEFKYPLVDTSGFPVLDSNNNQEYAWKHMWAMTGLGDSILTPPNFKLAIFRVNDTFFYKGFQFRFNNYANPSGNLNHWHIDYVWLDRQRKKDTLINDIALQKMPTPLLATYYLVPATHLLNDATGFIGNIAKNIYGSVRNNGTDSNNINTNFNSIVKSIFSTAGVPNTYPFSSFINSQNIFPLTSKTFKDSTVRTNGTKNVSLIHPLTLQTLSFLTMDSINPAKGGDMFTGNDRALRKQTLTDIYAYDDGSAEAGVGLTNSQSGQMAVEFTPLKDDVLQGILIHFNQSELDISSYNFNLIVWRSIDLVNPPGRTRDVIAWQLNNANSFYLNWPNDYIYFPLDSPIALTGTFYIGWQQSIDFVLNVGLDKNYDEISNGQANPHLYYNVAGNWQQNIDIHGAPMIRAVMGTIPYVGIEKQKSPEGAIKLFPNPSNGKFTLTLPDNTPCDAALYSMNSTLISTNKNLIGTPDLDYSRQPSGMYLLKVNSDKQVWWNKVIIR